MTGFYKGLPGYTRKSEELLARDAEKTAYYWWWRFMQLSPVLWYAQKEGIKPVDNNIFATVGIVGDLKERNFTKWWDRTGKFVFAESKRPPKILVVKAGQMVGQNDNREGIILDIPLTISKATILKDFKEILTKHHKGRQLNVAEYGTASLRLHTKKYHLQALENEYWTLLYKLLFPSVEIWRIGDRLKISPSLRVRGIERKSLLPGAGNPFENLQSLTGRYLYKAKYMMLHAERGSFPNKEKIELDLSYEPFEKLKMQGYLNAINGEPDQDSTWIAWLRKQYESNLLNQIASKNGLEAMLNSNEPRLTKRFRNFVLGIENLI